MTRHFDEDLEALRRRLLEMGELALRMIGNASRVLEGQDESFGRAVGEDEELVNRLHVEIDDECLRLIALHQPAAGDLRLIAAALKVNTDLERIADQAVNVAETGAFLAKAPRAKLGDIPRMVELASSMVKDALAAFSRRDVELARSVVARDDEEDRLKSETLTKWLSQMQKDSSDVQRGLDLILVSRNLERIADHATNIAEDVVFMVLGQDIRHSAGKAQKAP